MPSVVRAYTHLCSELVSLIYDSGCDGLRVEVGNLEEIGEWNACVLVDTPIAPGMRVAILCQGHQMQGLVETCSIDEVLGCFVRIGLDPDSRWSESRFRPKHLYAVARQAEPHVAA